MNNRFGFNLRMCIQSPEHGVLFFWPTESAQWNRLPEVIKWAGTCGNHLALVTDAPTSEEARGYFGGNVPVAYRFALHVTMTPMPGATEPTPENIRQAAERWAA